MTEREIFLALLDLPDPAARAKYLDAACSGDPARRARIEALLLSHDTAGSFLGSPAVKPPETDTLATQGSGSVATPDDDANEINADLKFLAAPRRPDSLGRIGHYEVLEVLGRGGFGIVFRAFDETLQRVVAVKVLAPQIAATSPARKRFLREARSSAKVRHENVVQVYAVEEQPLPYLVMEFIPGETLQQRLVRTGPLETVEVVRIGRQIAEGLAAAHNTGLIHRDIKPANILIEASPHPCVKITDFGLARAADDASLTQSGMVAGTPMFMAPEQARGETLDHRADLFSLGSVLYTMCSGRPPFRANSTLAVLKRVAEDVPRPIREIIPEVPQWLCEIIARLHAKKPEDRIATAREVADLLGHRLADMQRPGNVPTLPEVPPATVEKLPPFGEIPNAAPALRRPRFRTRRWAAAAAVLLMLLGGLGFTEATGVTNVRGTVIRLFSPDGTLVVEVDDPEVSVKIDGSDIVITGAGAKEIRLEPGSYTVEARKDGKLVSQELVTVMKNGRQVVRVSQEAPPRNTKAVSEEKNPDREVAEHVLSMGGLVRVNEQLTNINAAKDLPKGPFRFTGVEWVRNPSATDAGLATLKNCNNLTWLNLNYNTKVTDAGLAHFKDHNNLTHVQLAFTQVTDAGVAHFAGCKRMALFNLNNTKVSDVGLASLRNFPHLLQLHLADTPIDDAGLTHIRRLTQLFYVQLNGTKVTAKGVADFAKSIPRCAIVWDGGTIEPRVAVTPPATTLHDAWIKAVAALPLDKQGAVVAAKMKERLPGFEDAFLKAIPAMPADRQVVLVAAWLKERNPGFDGAVVPTIENDAVIGLNFTTDSVTDIYPLRALTRLRKLEVIGSNTRKGALADLSPLKGMNLSGLNVSYTQVADLTPLKGMQLEMLNIAATRVVDLSALKDMKVTRFYCNDTQVRDLASLKDIGLEVLDCSRIPASDLSPLMGAELHWLKCQNMPAACDLAPLKDLPLGMLWCDFNAERDAKILRAIKTLETINDKPAAEFWACYEKGEFKK